MSYELFKEIDIGGLCKAQLSKKLADAGIQFNEYAHILFENKAFDPSTEFKKVVTIRGSLHQLDLAKPSSYAEITDRALSLKMQLCPLYLAAFLRLEYLEQEEGPYMTIASEKPPECSNSDKYPNGFYLRNIDSVLWLRGYFASDDFLWPLDSEFVFLG